jgi:hypothetical protein
VSRRGTAPLIEEQAVTLAWGAAAQRGEIGALAGAVADWADDALAGGTPPKEVARLMVIANRLIARAARGQAVTI